AADALASVVARWHNIVFRQSRKFSEQQKHPLLLQVYRLGSARADRGSRRKNHGVHSGALE
ncbi:MAG: hypothetical protein UFR61_01580, partial [Faecalibacterium sp.]|nr:hypothetical protein [Faecalibacterium sp.]